MSFILTFKGSMRSGDVKMACRNMSVPKHCRLCQRIASIEDVAGTVKIFTVPAEDVANHGSHVYRNTQRVLENCFAQENGG
jgi:hypothetical protein